MKYTMFEERKRPLMALSILFLFFNNFYIYLFIFIDHKSLFDIPTYNLILYVNNKYSFVF